MIESREFCEICPNHYFNEGIIDFPDKALRIVNGQAICGAMSHCSKKIHITFNNPHECCLLCHEENGICKISSMDSFKKELMKVKLKRELHDI
jgi:hypothetical protein